MKCTIMIIAAFFILGCNAGPKYVETVAPLKERHIDYFSRLHGIYQAKNDAFLSINKIDSALFYLGKMMAISEACNYEYEMLYPKKYDHESKN